MCPVCQTILRPGELQEHMEQELTKVAHLQIRYPTHVTQINNILYLIFSNYLYLASNHVGFYTHTCLFLSPTLFIFFQPFTFSFYVIFLPYTLYIHLCSNN